MLEAEIPSGDIQEVTQAIQNALRPTTIVHQRVVTPTLPPLNGEEVNRQDLEILDINPNDVGGEDIQTDISTSAPKRVTGSRPRAYRTPQVLDVDLTSNPSWDGYASSRNPGSDADRFLTAAAWFKECRNQPAVTADHVYTCYRAVKWPAAIDDFSAPLRHLKHRQLLGSAGRGEYAINHLGLARVEELMSK